MNRTVLFVAVLIATFPADAHAYIDPGAGAALITAVLGFVGAAGLIVRKYWGKLQSLFSRSDRSSEDDG
ncbi:MAG: hypothetical protein OXF45_00460 [Candidatus Dadabacteria bacterium]|nr:hypothetical protein [Candidatus Dadabacteria bacterium]